MKLILRTFSIVFILVLFTSCATIVSRSSWPLKVETNPSGAKVEVKDKDGKVVYNGNSPAKMSLSSGAGYFNPQSYTVKLTLNGYEEKKIQIDCVVNPWYYGNIFLGGLIGMVFIDPASGAMYELQTNYLDDTLTKK
jgi:hypothetical protein